jgi:signal transduction histidine kinase/ActR/RegA family two-component response regulator
LPLFLFSLFTKQSGSHYMDAAAAIAQQVVQLLADAEAAKVHSIKQSSSLSHSALQLSQQIGNDALIAQSLSATAFYHMISGAHAQSLLAATEAATLFETLADEKGLADVKYTIASVHYKTDNIHLGLQYLLECLAIYRKHNDHANMAKAYKVLGTIYEFFEDADNAIDAYEAAVASAQQVGNLNLETNAYNPLSGLYLNRNNIEKATELIERSLLLKKQTGDVRGLAFALYGRGKIYTQTGQYDLAATDFTEAIAIHNEMGEKLGLGMAMQKMGVLYFKQEKFVMAKGLLLQAFEWGEKLNSRILKTKSSYLLYQVYKKKGAIAEALQYLEIHEAEQAASARNQTQQMVYNYKMIHQMEAKALEDRMQLERAEMMEKKNKAEYAAKARQDFLSNMSHEIRTPLNAVINITNLLKERADAEDQQLLDSLKFASDNLLMLINDILDLTKLETDKVALEKHAVNIRHLLSNVKNTYDVLAREKGLQLNLHITPQVGLVYELDDIKLVQILGNLLSNAIKFTDEGHVTLRVEKLGETAAGCQLRFEVSDTGAGIPEDFMGELFNAFTQPKSVTTKKQGGSGLGLAIVKKLVALHQSEVSIESKPGAGSTFSFDLVLQAGHEPVAAAPKADIQLSGLRVLLAEDNKINTLVATKLLQRWGIQADLAKNGVEAVALAEQKKFDIILMDIHMPELNGYDATLAIRKKGLNATSAIYALTADISAKVQQQYIGYFDGFLHKPIEVNRLYEVLSGLLATAEK